MGQQLLGNFNAFKDPNAPQYITTKSLKAMAGRPLTGNAASDQNIRLARELARRPELVKAMDRNSITGGLDGLIDRQKIGMIIQSDNPYKYLDDQQLAGEMLKKFDGLQDAHAPGHIKIERLKTLAGWPLTGNPAWDGLIHVAREVSKRSDLLRKMDNLASQDSDGWIRKQALRLLSH
ncbi:hypothetical protein GIR22_07205 [Pseudomonas sp. CCM 7891]|uniref:Uncharacterized protein n=1 Tax=Pseudomonas karstica TaxID=1055468 RepID=A0A7X2RQZ6_9PSED|nr:hypothetical protein [Pseudomonas karstica]